MKKDLKHQMSRPDDPDAGAFDPEELDQDKDLDVEETLETNLHSYKKFLEEETMVIT